jgi:hypothetical protein
MRSIERVSGSLAGLLSILALVFSLTQRTVRSVTGTVTYAPRVTYDNTLSLVTAMGLAVVASLIVAFSAMQDTRDLARGVWRWLLLLGAVLCVGGIWVETAQSQAAGFQISAGLLLAPALLAAIICALAAQRPRTGRSRLSHKPRSGSRRIALAALRPSPSGGLRSAEAR